MTRLVLILLTFAAIALAAAGFLFYRLGYRFGHRRAIDDVATTYGDRLIGAPPANDLELSVWGEELTNVGGSSRQEIIAKLHEGDDVELVRHPGDVDTNMIAVVSEKGEIGRLTQSDAASLAPYLDRGGRVTAQVSAVRGGTKDRPELHVWILVRPLDQI